MTAGSYCYIGPQGIVHGTTVRLLSAIFEAPSNVYFPFHSCMSQLTVLNAGRKYLGANSLAGRVFLTSGLGGMSGAQAKVGKVPFKLYLPLLILWDYRLPRFADASASSRR